MSEFRGFSGAEFYSRAKGLKARYDLTYKDDLEENIKTDYVKYEQREATSDEKKEKRERFKGNKELIEKLE